MSSGFIVEQQLKKYKPLFHKSKQKYLGGRVVIALVIVYS